MMIEYASEFDFQYLCENDKHIPKNFIQAKIRDREIIMAKNAQSAVLGWLRFGYFWDNTPFMNMLFIDEKQRSRGIGTKLNDFWENEMRNRGFALVMTSSLSNERAQHFYRKLGYKDAGSLLLENEPLEIIFTKRLI